MKLKNPPLDLRRRAADGRVGRGSLCSWWTLWHPAGGACRGDALDAESLELRGCEGVCVVGAAAMPALPRVNPSLSCYAMGWRLGELLAAE